MEGDQQPGQNSPLLWQRTSRDLGGTRLHGCVPTVGPGLLLQELRLSYQHPLAKLRYDREQLGRWRSYCSNADVKRK